MKKALALVMIPAGAITKEYLANLLNKEVPTAEQSPFVCRITRAQLRSAKTPAQEEFSEDSGLKVWLHDLNPFPKLSSWAIGGKFAGCLRSFGTDASIQVSTQELESVENNSVPAKEFGFKFYPDILIDLAGSWTNNPNGVDSNGDTRWAKRMRRAVENCAVNTTLVVIEITMDNIVEQNSLFH